MNLTRKEFLTFSAGAVGATAFACFGADKMAGAADSELVPVDGFQAVLHALDRYPLVGIGDAHMCEQSHAFLRSLVGRRDLQHKVDDIVVEFGNAIHQDIADRFFLHLQPVEFDELSKMWRDDTLGGRVYWDAPVYEQFYRTVRQINESLPRRQRIRVVLGDVPVDWPAIRSVADADKLPTEDQRETYYAATVEREVLAKHRRALLIVGGDHLRRGCHTNPGELSPPKNPNQPTAGSILAARHPGSLYVIEPFMAVNSDIQSLPAGIPERMTQTMTAWAAPSIAALANTWLGPQPMPFRAFDPHSTFQQEADAVLWLGSDQALRCSRANPALYESGAYAEELRRRSELLTQISGNQIDLVAEGLHLANLGSSCLER